MNIGLIHLYTILYRVCVFTVTVRYSVYQLDIQIEKVRNIALIYLFSIIYGVCVFTVTVCYSVGQFCIKIVLSNEYSTNISIQ